jgi:hypothetical protein
MSAARSCNPNTHNFAVPGDQTGLLMTRQQVLGTFRDLLLHHCICHGRYVLTEKALTLVNLPSMPTSFAFDLTRSQNPMAVQADTGTTHSR